MADLNKQSLEMWNAMKPMVDREIDQQTKGAVQRRKAKVTTAPSLVTKKIGVTEPFGDQYFIPYDAKVAGAKVGDVVWVEYMYGASNAFASMFAKAVEDPRFCSAILSSAGWYRVAQFAAPNAQTAQGRYVFAVDMTLCNVLNDVHKITLFATNYVLNFTNEVSQTSGTQELDKIRYTYNGTDAFIDVHFVGTTGRTVKFFFDVQTNLDFLKLWTAQAFTSVADAPAGETVVTTYEFSGNTDYHESSTVDGVWHDISRSGDIVTITINSFGGKNLTANTYVTVWTIPQGFRPKTTVYGVADNLGGGRLIGYNVSSTGTINLYANGSNTSYFAFSATYICS